MIWVRVAMVLVVVTFITFAWCLCRIAAITDKRDRELAQRLREKQGL